MTLPEPVSSNLSPSNTTNPQPRPSSEVSHIDTTQQSSCFSDLPPELRDRIYAFAVQPGVMRGGNGKEHLVMPELTTGFAKSLTARALSQVCRSVCKEPIEVYYSKTTFLVSDVTDSWSPIPHNRFQLRREAMNRWVKTWGVLAGPHIRSLSISALSTEGEGVVLISMDSQTNAASYTDKINYRGLNECKLNAVALKAFSSQGPDITAAEKLAVFFDGIGTAILDGQLAAEYKFQADVFDVLI
jgi:hypothetical protein